MTLKEALEALCRYSNPEKLVIKKDKEGMYKIELGLHITATEAHHVMTVLEELEAPQERLVPDMVGQSPVVGFRSSAGD